MVKTVSIADYQAARSLDDQVEREPYESIAERLQRLGVRSQADAEMPLGEIKGLVRDAAEEAGILAGVAEIDAEAELRADGTTRVSYVKNQTVSAGELVLPPTLTIAIPVLKGHTEADDDLKLKPVLYRLVVRMRVSVGDDARLAFRLSMPDAERVLEAVYADRVQAARIELGADFSILRATA